MKILQLIPNMTGGGAERQLVYLSGALVRRGWDVHVGLIREGPNFEKLVASGCKIHKIPAIGNHDVLILWHLIKLIRDVRPHLVQTWMRQMDVFGGIASKLTGIPYIISERSVAHAYSPLLKHKLRIVVGRSASAIATNSRGGCQYWHEQIGDNVPKHIVNNILPLEDIERAVPSCCDNLCPSPDSKISLFVGRLSSVKNIEMIIRAFKMVEAQQDVVLLICGEGELQSKIKDLILEEHLTGRVILLGYVNNVWELMKRADLFISLSNYEGLPNTVLEAIACDCPLILSDIPSHRDFLNDEKALFVDQGRVSDIAAAILSCLEDPARARQRAQKARADISSFSSASVAEQYQNIYSRILSNNT